MEIPSHKSKWVCGLSNGETLVEGSDEVSLVKGELSPWLKLIEYIRINELKITSLGIWIGDRHYNLPSINPKFGGEVPVGYNCKRLFRADSLSGGGKYEHYVCIEAIYPTYKLQIWIDEIDDNKMWVSVINGSN